MRRRVFRSSFAVIAVLTVAVSLGIAFRPTAGSTDVATAAALGPSTRDLPAAATGNFHRVSGVAPAVGRKPTVVFVGAQYCPFCAAERWALVKALSQFGRFSGLRRSTNQAGSDGFSLVPTFDLTAAIYASQYIAFDHKDTADRNGAQLQTLTAQEQGWFNRYDSQGSIPLVVIGHYAMVGSGYDPSAIDGMSFMAVQSALQSGTTSLTRKINAETNVITALICHDDGGQPAAVCGGSTVSAVESRLH